MNKYSRLQFGIIIFGILLSGRAPAETTPLEAAVETKIQAQQDLLKSQKNIDELVEQTNDLEREYKNILIKTDSLNTYNRQLSTLIEKQKLSLNSIQRQLDNVEETRRSIVPLMIKMIATLERFIALDQPFLVSERRQRIALLKEMMDRPEVTLPDKYRRIMEAYQIEVEYGRTMETYNDTINLDGREYTVDILRVGRLLIAFQTPDGNLSGLWNKKIGAWVTLPDKYTRSIKQGLRMAGNQAARELISLPINITGE